MSAHPTPPSPQPSFKRTCPCTILPPPFLIFQIPPSDGGNQNVFYRFIYCIQLWFTKYLPIIQLINTNKTILKYNRNQNYIILQLQTQFTTAGSRFPVFNVFLKILNLVNVLNLFGTVFHIRPSSKQRACVPYLEVLVSGNFNNCLLWRSYRVFFKSKKCFMIGGLILFIDLYISMNNICMLFSWTFHELSFNSRSSKFAFSISYNRRRVRLCVSFIWLFEVLLQNIQIKGQYLKADII